MLRTFLLVGVGGAAGSMARYATTLLLTRASANAFPAATMLVNLMGCLLIGVLAGWAERSVLLNNAGWALLATGFCGGFTTFSAFALDNMKLQQGGASGTALVYSMISIVGGMLLCYIGYHLATTLWK